MDDGQQSADDGRWTVDDRPWTVDDRHRTSHPAPPLAPRTSHPVPLPNPCSPIPNHPLTLPPMPPISTLTYEQALAELEAAVA
ncbi:MAG TPA: hypothetical protein ENJ02_00095, partial [Chloroflexi bacterium]|nr:hypothetical protein [Chloroflexota bacterium]